MRKEFRSMSMGPSESDQLRILRAENAALAARVKELEAVILSGWGSSPKLKAAAERERVLLTRVAEMEGALERIIKRTNGPSYTMAGVICSIAGAALSHAPEPKEGKS